MKILTTLPCKYCLCSVGKRQIAFISRLALYIFFNVTVHYLNSRLKVFFFSFKFRAGKNLFQQLTIYNKRRVNKFSLHLKFEYM